MTGYSGSAGRGTRRRRPSYYYDPSSSAGARAHPRRGRRGGFLSRVNFGTVFAVLGALIAAGIIAFILLWFFSSYFNVRSISLSESGKYSAEEVISASGLTTGVKLYSVDADTAEKRILESFPEMKSVKVRKELPCDLVIDIAYELPRYYITVTGENYTLSETLRVLDRNVSETECRVLSLTKLTLPTIKRAVTGEKLELFDDDGGHLESFLEVFSDSYFSDKIDRIDILSRFDITLTKIGGYRISVGDTYDMSLKLKMAEKVLEEGSYDGTDGVMIDVSDPSEAGVRQVKTLKIE